MLKTPASFVLASLGSSTLSEVGCTGGDFPFAKTYVKGERIAQSAVCTSSDPLSLRPRWTVVLSILRKIGLN